MIDTSNFKFLESRWQDIFSHLQKSGFDVYPPGVKVGDCLVEYIVVKNNGSARLAGFSTDSDYYSVMCYVPRDKYSSLEPLVQKVKRAMKGLEPMILQNGSQTPSYYDDTYKAHMVSIEYKNYKKL